MYLDDTTCHDDAADKKSPTEENGDASAQNTTTPNNADSDASDDGHEAKSSLRKVNSKVMKPKNKTIKHANSKHSSK